MYYKQKNVEFARKLRKEMTPWERKLWYTFLNKYPVRFQRQKPIGDYIADFYCAKAMLVIELDGGGHYDPESKKRDAERTKKLEKIGLTVIRFCNKDIDKSFYSVCTVIDETVKEKLPPALCATPLKEGGKAFFPSEGHQRKD